MDRYTDAAVGVMGVIPGSMASPGFVVRGRGVPDSLDSASHGAGRKMSRTAAREKYRWAHVRPLLEQAGVTLLSAGIDENPHAYKDIRQATQLAREMTVPLPAANGATELMQLARALGFGGQDSTAVIRGLETLLKIEVRGERG